MSIIEWSVFCVLSALVVWGILKLPYRPARKEQDQHEDKPQTWDEAYMRRRVRAGEQHE
jgi:hypothetical protein